MWLSLSIIESKTISCLWRSLLLKPSSSILQPFMRHLTLTLPFSPIFTSLPHFPFDPRPIFPSSSSLCHCHSVSNFPAIAAFFPAQSFRQPIYTVAGHIYLLEVWRVRLCLYQLLDSLAVVPAALGSPWLRLFASWEFALNLAGVNSAAQNERHVKNLLWGVCDTLHLKLL